MIGLAALSSKLLDVLPIFFVPNAFQQCSEQLVIDRTEHVARKI